MFSDDCFEARVHGSIISSILPATCKIWHKNKIKIQKVQVENSQWQIDQLSECSLFHLLMQIKTKLTVQTNMEGF